MNYILIYDFGSQYTHVLVKLIRNLNVYCLVEQPTLPLKSLQNNLPLGIIFSGGPFSITDENAPTISDENLSFIRNKNIPILGICYGLQLLTHLDGGTIDYHTNSEYGEVTFEITEPDNLLFNDVPNKSIAWMSHSGSIAKLPPGYNILGKSNNNNIAATCNIDLSTWLVLFHPEVHHSEHGDKIIKNFLFGICKIIPDWTAVNSKLEQIKYVRETVGKSKVLAAVSGGKDSTVAAALVHAAVGDQLVAVFIDNGLLRQNEGQEALERIRSEIPGINLHLFDAADLFLERLKGVDSSLERRRVIGKAYIDSFILFAKNHNLNDKETFLLQGTIYSDYIESGRSSSNSAVIKPHHNVGGLPADLGFKLLEPIKFLFKDEVLKLGKELGLSNKTLKRHPFPGPSFAIRIFGPLTKENIEILRRSTFILEDELISSELYDQVSQAFVVLLPNICTNSVKGDKPDHKNMTAVIRCVNTTDFMTCSWSKLPMEFLAKVSTRITNEINEISRVTYDITNKPPATVEWM